MFILHPWPTEPLGARTSYELTERQPTSLTSLAWERPKGTQEGSQSSAKVRKITVRLVISFLRICQSDITENKLGKTTAGLTFRGWQELLAPSHSHLSHSIYQANKHTLPSPSTFFMIFCPITFSKNVQRLQRNEVTS